MCPRLQEEGQHQVPREGGPGAAGANNNQGGGEAAEEGGAYVHRLAQMRFTLQIMAHLGEEFNANSASKQRMLEIVCEFANSVQALKEQVALKEEQRAEERASRAEGRAS